MTNHDPVRSLEEIIAAVFEIVRNPHGLARPSARVHAATVRFSPAPALPREEMIRQLRILHPDAVALMPDGTRQPCAGMIHFTMGGPGVIPLAIFNPDELTPDAMWEQMQSPENRRRIACAVNGMKGGHPSVARRDMTMEMREAGAHLDATAGAAQSLVESMRDRYPPAPDDLDAYYEAAKVAERKHETGGWWWTRKLRARAVAGAHEAMKAHGESISEALLEGSIPTLSVEDRRRIENNLRQRMADLPIEFLTFMHAAAIPVWAADGISFGEFGVVRGLANGNHHVMAMLTDTSIGVLVEELTHTADHMMNFTPYSGLSQALFEGPIAQRIPEAERNFLNDLVEEYIHKQGLFKDESHYRIDPNLRGQEKYQARDSVAKEYLANLVHMHTMPLGDVACEQVGALLSKHFPKKKLAENMGPDELRQAMRDALPCSIGYYDSFMNKLAATNVRLSKGRAPKMDSGPIIIRGE